MPQCSTVARLLVERLDDGRRAQVGTVDRTPDDVEAGRMMPTAVPPRMDVSARAILGFGRRPSNAALPGGGYLTSAQDGTRMALASLSTKLRRSSGAGARRRQDLRIINWVSIGDKLQTTPGPAHAPPVEPACHCLYGPSRRLCWMVRTTPGPRAGSPAGCRLQSPATPRGDWRKSDARPSDPPPGLP